MTEDEYLGVVERIQMAMAIEPFRPEMTDVVRLLADWRTHWNLLTECLPLVRPETDLSRRVRAALRHQ